MAELSWPRQKLVLGSFYEEKGIKIQVSRPFESILGIDLQRLCPKNPLGVLTVCPQTPISMSRITHYFYDPGKVTTSVPPPKFISCIRPCHTVPKRQNTLCHMYLHKQRALKNWFVVTKN